MREVVSDTGTGTTAEREVRVLQALRVLRPPLRVERLGVVPEPFVPVGNPLWNQEPSPGWNNVDVLQADATTADLGEGFDAAIATLSVSVMPDVHRAIENVYRSLASGRTFVVFDLRTVPSRPARIVNPLLWRLFYWFANWNPDGNTIDSLTAVFEQVELVETCAAGAAYTARARQQ
jgi:SAM-dependent methyltransferase